MRKITITTDNDNFLVWEDYKEHAQYLFDEIKTNVHIEQKGNNYQKLIHSEDAHDSYKYHMDISAKGYIQCDWLDFKLYYDDYDDLYLQLLIDHLKKYFTHKNSYLAEVCEVETINGKTFVSEDKEYFGFHIDHVEFPSEDDVKKMYIDSFGIDKEDEICLKL